MNKRRFFALAAVLFAFLSGCACAKEPAEKPKEYVVILSMDAFRYDLPDNYSTPTLDSIKRVGVFSEIMPCFPANTFPNHYSMATGLYPDHHGIVNNSFYDKAMGKSYSITDDEARVNPGFYKGEPIWNTVERQGLKAHVYTWVGVEAPIGGHQPTKYVVYSSSRTRKQLADMVLAALCNPDVAEIPDLTMWYFDEPDATEHHNGPLSPATRTVVEDIDSVLAYFMTAVRRSPVFDRINFIFTSDHGMADLSPDRYYNIYGLIPGKAKYFYNSTPMMLEPAEADVEEVYATLKSHEAEGHYTVWRRAEVPERFHYGSFTNRIQPLVLLPETGWKVVYSPVADYQKPGSGTATHGFDPYDRNMHMVFYGCGPSFKQGYVHDKVFQNLNDYLIICHLLKVQPARNDCSWEDIEGLFR